MGVLSMLPQRALPSPTHQVLGGVHVYPTGRVCIASPGVCCGQSVLFPPSASVKWHYLHVQHVHWARHGSLRHLAVPLGVH